VPFFALCLFAGHPAVSPHRRNPPAQTRAREAQRRHHPDDGEVSKIREPRTIAIQPKPGRMGLRAYPLEKFPIIRQTSSTCARRPSKSSTSRTTSCRHTFISMFVAKFRSIGEAALQAGNSESIIRKHYLDHKDPSEAEQFLRDRAQAPSQTLSCRSYRRGQNNGAVSRAAVGRADRELKRSET